MTSLSFAAILLRLIAAQTLKRTVSSSNIIIIDLINFLLWHSSRSVLSSINHALSLEFRSFSTVFAHSIVQMVSGAIYIPLKSVGHVSTFFSGAAAIFPCRQAIDQLGCTRTVFFSKLVTSHSFKKLNYCIIVSLLHMNIRRNDA